MAWSLFFALACHPTSLPEIDPAENTTGYDASIEVRVLVCDPQTDPQCLEAYGAPGASVYVYLTEEDRDFGEPLYRSGITGGEQGTVRFSALDPGKRFYLSTVYLGEAILSSETAPVNGIAKHEVIFVGQ